MHPYLPYLLEDIQNAEREPTSVSDFSPPQSIEEELELSEKWVSGEMEKQTFGEVCGLKTEDFPPAKQLTEEDIIKVFRAFGHLLYTWNADIDLPESLPWKLKYKFMTHVLKEGFAILDFGTMVFDFCTGYAPDCVFGQYCSCLKYWEEKE